jgi:hypothetical protein
VCRYDTGHVHTPISSFKQMLSSFCRSYTIFILAIHVHPETTCFQNAASCYSLRTFARFLSPANSCDIDLGDVSNAVANADYSACSGAVTGDTCTVGCEDGNAVSTASTGFELVCDESGGFDGSDATLVCTGRYHCRYGVDFRQSSFFFYVFGIGSHHRMLIWPIHSVDMACLSLARVYMPL